MKHVLDALEKDEEKEEVEEVVDEKDDKRMPRKWTMPAPWITYSKMTTMRTLMPCREATTISLRRLKRKGGRKRGTLQRSKQVS
ncbi:hypothetical protein AG1IA_10010 [Rhizoctonia solani AG-1 IA]|uniref:Uncharacterized protein n=1 Tax=Thanatephorus cucumeris (strain AG1-IA) TaxID=983506 RepID=L8WDC0_THACA|nr:hypothetical protein AG1IA_10010 [Rhizoctonia solani AG-1 IA]